MNDTNAQASNRVPSRAIFSAVHELSHAISHVPAGPLPADEALAMHRIAVTLRQFAEVLETVSLRQTMPSGNPTRSEFDQLVQAVRELASQIHH